MRSLLIAIEKNDTAAVSSLISKHVVNGKPPPLMVAAEHGHVEIMAMLLDGGAEIDVVDGLGQTACHVAIQKNHFRALQLLISRGASLAVLDARQMAPFDYSQHRNDDRFTIALLEAAVPLHNVSPDALIAAAARSVAILRLMLSLNVNIGALRNRNSQTACHVVISYPHDSVTSDQLLRMLINDARVDIDSVDQLRESACHHAAISGKLNAFTFSSGRAPTSMCGEQTTKRH